MRLGPFQTFGIDQIALGENDKIGASNLIFKNLFDRIVMIKCVIGLTLRCKRLEIVGHTAFRKRCTVHHSNNRIDRYPAFDRWPLESLDQGFGKRKAGCLDEDMLNAWLTAQNLLDGGHKIIGHGAAYAAIRQFYDVFLRAAFNAAPPEDFTIYPDIAELIDDDGKTFAIQSFEQAAQKCGFPGAEKTGDDSARDTVKL
jgi:hypothetical protein